MKEEETGPENTIEMQVVEEVEGVVRGAKGEEEGVAENHEGASGHDAWTTSSIIQAFAIFIASGFAEIGGGWLIWQAVRGGDHENGGRPRIWALYGSLLLVLYGFLPTFQPQEDASFGRIYAVYGGFFIVLSFLAGWVLDGDRPDRGDWFGGMVVMVGVLTILFWPRSTSQNP